MKTKIILILFLISFAGLFAQQKAKLQKVDESGFIEVDKTPELISKLNPEYPKLAKLAGIEGTVYLKLLIDEKGNVAKAKVEQGVKDMIDESALKAAKTAKFSPAILKDKPIKVWVVLPIAFKLALDKKEPPVVSPGVKALSNISDEDPDPGKFIEVEKMPELIESVKPEYPEIAKRAGITGKVFVKVLIDKEGLPKKAMVIKSESELFNQSAVNAAMKSKFTPAMNDGKPLAVWIVLPYKFALDGAKKEDINNGSARYFDTIEQAKSYYNGYTFMYGNKENREAIGAAKDVTFEKIDGQISFGEESELYKVISEKKTKYNFIARKDAIVYQYSAQTIEEIKKYVDELIAKEK